MNDYILVFHDNLDLYRDIVIRLQVKSKNTYEEIFDHFNGIATELMDSLYGFGEWNGDWELLRMTTLNEIETITY